MWVREALFVEAKPHVPPQPHGQNGSVVEPTTAGEHIAIGPRIHAHQHRHGPTRVARVAATERMIHFEVDPLFSASWPAAALPQPTWSVESCIQLNLRPRLARESTAGANQLDRLVTGFFYGFPERSRRQSSVAFGHDHSNRLRSIRLGLGYAIDGLQATSNVLGAGGTVHAFYADCCRSRLFRAQHGGRRQ